MDSSKTSKKLPPIAARPLDISFSEDLLATLSRHFGDFGDAFRAFCPDMQRDIYVFSHPDYVKHVLVSHQTNYTKGIGIDRVGILLGKGIMVSEGDLWRQQRKMIQPAFHPQFIDKMARHILSANLRLRERWMASAHQGEPINLTQDMSDVTLQIVLRAVFGDDLDCINNAAGGNPFALLTDDTERNLTFAYKFRLLSKLILDVIDRRCERAQNSPDLLSMLMDARDRKSGEPMPQRQLLDEIMTIIVAGHETTASALNWMWYLLSQHDDAAKRLHHEIDAIPGDILQVAELEQLTFTRQVIEETLRLYPPGWLLTRRTIGQDIINGYELEPGTDVFISPYIVHRHPQFWSDPERFDPDRFSAENCAQRNRFSYLPFALGPRACIGEHFAMVEMLMHTALLAREIHLRYVPQQPIELECQINLRTRHNLMMIPDLRRNR